MHPKRSPMALVKAECCTVKIGARLADVLALVKRKITELKASVMKATAVRQRLT